MSLPLGWGLFPSLRNHPPQIRKKFLHHAEPHIARHGDAETDCAIPRRVLTRRLPETGEESSGCNPAHLGNRDVPSAVIVAGKDTARHGIPAAGPEALLAGIEVSVVFV